jgi:hypothetical protein
MSQNGSAESGPGLPVVLEGQLAAFTRDLEENGIANELEATRQWLYETNPEVLVAMNALATAAANRETAEYAFNPRQANAKEVHMTYGLLLFDFLRKSLELTNFTHYEEQFAA